MGPSNLDEDVVLDVKFCSSSLAMLLIEEGGGRKLTGNDVLCLCPLL